MKAVHSIYAKGIRLVQRNFPGAYLTANLRFSREAGAKVARLVPLMTVRRLVAAALIEAGKDNFDLGQFPVGSDIRITDLTVKVRPNDVVLRSEEHQGYIERAVKRTTDLSITEAVVEVHYGDRARGVILSLNYSRQIVNHGFTREKAE